MSPGAMHMPPPEALQGNRGQNNPHGRGPGLNMPQIAPMGMAQQGMGGADPSMLGPGMKAPPSFGGPTVPIQAQYAYGGQYESAQPSGMAMGGNFDQSFSPQPSPVGSRPSSMAFSSPPMSPAGSRPTSEQVLHQPTRGFTNNGASVSASAHEAPDPFDTLASFK